MSRKKDSGSGKNKAGNKPKIIYDNKIERKLSVSHLFKNISLFIIILVPLAASFYYAYHAYKVNNFLSFPLDDPWIHLTFARNLIETFKFSYFPGDAAVAASTSPLYTILLAPAFQITSNEMIISYALGIICFTASAYIFYRLAVTDFDNELLFCLLCTVLYGIDLLLNFIAVSGMETSLYILLLLTGVLLYKKRKPVQLGLVMGLIIWTRPDGIAFIFAVAADYLIYSYLIRDIKDKRLFTKKQILTICLIFFGIAGLYGLMNLLMSGSILPTTFNAKVAYYIDLGKRMEYLTDKVGGMFKYGHNVFFFIPFIFSVIKVVYDLFKRKYNNNTLYFVFMLFFIALYWIKLPEVNRFYRYLLPVLPFYLLLSMSAVRELFRSIGMFLKVPKLFTLLQYTFILMVTGFAVKNYFFNSEQYANQSKFIYERQVKAAQWINANTKEDDIIATHDIGAIGYYGKRRIVDVAGLIDKELAKHINKENYPEIMTEYMDNKGVNYVAFMPEWYILANQNYSFRGPEQITKENMVVSKYVPQKTHVISRKANSVYMNSFKHILKGDGKKIVESMNELIKLDTAFAYSYYYRGYGNLLQKDTARYLADIERALEIYPDFIEALIEYGIGLVHKNRHDEARVYLERALIFDPDNEKAKGALEYLSRIVK